MGTKLTNHLVFNLKNELERTTPNLWESIRKKIAGEVARELLNELDGLPSPQGRMLGELASSAKDQMISISKGA